MRIHELARKYDVRSEELVELLRKAGYDVKNHMSSVDYDMLAALERHFSWTEDGGRGKTRSRSRAKATTKTRTKKAASTAADAEKATTKTATRTKAKAKVKAKAKAKVKAKAKAGTKAAGKTRTRTQAGQRAARISTEEVIRDLEAEEAAARARIKAKTKIIRKRRPEPEPEPPPAEAAPAATADAAPSATSTAAADTIADTATATPTSAGEAKPVGRPDATTTTVPEGPSNVPVEAKPGAPATPGVPAAAPAAGTTASPRSGAAAAGSGADTTHATASDATAAPVAPAKPGTSATPPAGTTKPAAAPPRRRRGRDAESQQRAVRESVRRTLAKLDASPRKSRRRKGRPSAATVVDLPPVAVQERSTPMMLASLFGVPVDELVEHLVDLGVEAQATTELDRDTIEVLAEAIGRTVEIEGTYGESRLEEAARVDPERFVPRAPVVTVMGHVDHGKTSILDAIRKARVADSEAGGITQHIGAYEVETPHGRVTFIDTPGHEAFTAMRARGAQITDIVVLVVAADDGVMPQTIEAINHTKAAGVPMVVAVNKIDVPGANPLNVKQQLTQHGVMVESFGGDVIDVDVSAKTGEGLDRLLEMIQLQAEMLEIKADPKARPQGVVLEAQKDEGRGILVSLLIAHGTLKIGDVIVMGNEWGKVRSLVDHQGRRIKSAGPGMPVQFLGADGLPEPGDRFVAVRNEREAREISDGRKQALRERQRAPERKIVSLEDLYAQIQAGEVKELPVIVKGDVTGSVEAIRESLAPMDVEGVRVKVLHAAVGVVTETDVLLAQGSNAIIIAFGTGVSPKARDLARRSGVDIRRYDIIYEVLEDVEKALKGMLEPEFVERVLGQAEVRQLFRVPRQGVIAGSLVVQGQIVRNARARVLRGGEVIYDGRVVSLKRFKDDVREVQENFECGIGLGFDGLAEGDVIEAYTVEEKTRAV